MSQDINKLLAKCQNLESILYMTQYSEYNNFAEMENYLEAADNTLTEKIDELEQKKELVIKQINRYPLLKQIQEEFDTSSYMYELNNKKRQKQQQLLHIERNKIIKQLDLHKERLNVQIHPMSMVLKQKKLELEKLQQTKQIIADFGTLIKGHQDQTLKMLPLDEKNFKNSALKIYVFKTILQDSQNEEHTEAKMKIMKKYSELKNKIIQNFKEGFFKKQQRLIMNALPYCQEYDLLYEVSDFYNEQAFSGVNQITNISQESATKFIQNLFFLIEKGISYAFSHIDYDTGEINPYQLKIIFKGYSDSVSRRLITYAFEKLIKISLENSMAKVVSPQSFLIYLENFYRESKNLIKNSQIMINDDKISHLMTTYFESIFDSYLEQYQSKQLNHLQRIYQDCSEKIARDIKAAGIVQISREQQIPTKKGNALNKMFTDVRIEQKRMSNQQIQSKIQALMNVFEMNTSIEEMFNSTKKSLQRNSKIARINQIDNNRNKIVNQFVERLKEIIVELIKQIKELVPSPQDKTLILQPEFFQILPQILMLLQRMEYLYEQYKRQTKYQFSEAIMLEQKKQKLLSDCERQINKVVAESISKIILDTNSKLREKPKIYCLQNSRDSNTTETCRQAISFLDKYLKVINKISLNNYKNSIMLTIGNQFIDTLISYYGTVAYTRDGVGKIYLDIAAYRKLVTQIDVEEVEKRFKSLQIMIDIYCMKNDEKQINQHFRQKREEQPHFKNEKEEFIKNFIANKHRNERD